MVYSDVGLKHLCEIDTKLFVNCHDPAEFVTTHLVDVRNSCSAFNCFSSGKLAAMMSVCERLFALTLLYPLLLQI